MLGATSLFSLLRYPMQDHLQKYYTKNEECSIHFLLYIYFLSFFFYHFLGINLFINHFPRARWKFLYFVQYSHWRQHFFQFHQYELGYKCCVPPGPPKVTSKLVFTDSCKVPHLISRTYSWDLWLWKSQQPFIFASSTK